MVAAAGVVLVVEGRGGGGCRFWGCWRDGGGGGDSGRFESPENMAATTVFLKYPLQPCLDINDTHGEGIEVG